MMQAEMNVDLYMEDLLTWFIKESGQRGYSDVNPPDECPDPVIVLREEDNEKSADELVYLNLECNIQGRTYYFSSELRTQNPTQGNSVFDNPEDFVQAMLNLTAPTMLMYGGS